jgi:molybdate transport system substrate-binding protein
VVLFARNKLCALVRPGLAVTPASPLDHLLDSDVLASKSRRSA